MTFDGDTTTDRFSPRRQMVVVCLLAAMGPLASTVTTGTVSALWFLWAFIVFLVGSYRVLRGSPSERFEVGTSEAEQQYKDITITAVATVEYNCPGNETEMKCRTVDVTAVTADGTMIAWEHDTDLIGSKPRLFGLIGGGYDTARSTTEHAVAVATTVHEAVDEWLVADDGDPAVKAVLETEFESIGTETSGNP